MKELLGTFFTTIIKVVVVVVIAIGVYRLSISAYDFGFMIFSDIPVATGDGRTVNVIVSENMDEKKLADALEEKGLVKNSMVFYIQEKLTLSEKDGIELVPGTYELNTAMTSARMLEVITGQDNKEEE